MLRQRSTPFQSTVAFSDLDWAVKQKWRGRCSWTVHMARG